VIEQRQEKDAKEAGKAKKSVPNEKEAGGEE